MGSAVEPNGRPENLWISEAEVVEDLLKLPGCSEDEVGPDAAEVIVSLGKREIVEAEVVVNFSERLDRFENDTGPEDAEVVASVVRSNGRAEEPEADV